MYVWLVGFKCTDMIVFDFNFAKDLRCNVNTFASVWEQKFSTVLTQYCSIEEYCSIIYFEVFGNLFKTSIY